MDTTSKRRKQAINNTSAEFKPDHFSLSINAPLSDSHCDGIRTTLIFLTNNYQQTNVYSTRDSKTHYNKSYIRSGMLYANDELCLVSETNNTVIYRVGTWSKVAVFNRHLKLKAAGIYLFYVDNLGDIVYVLDAEGRKVQAKLEHDKLSNIEVLQMPSQIITFSRWNGSVKIWRLNEYDKCVQLESNFKIQDFSLYSCSVRGGVVVLGDWHSNSNFHSLDGSSGSWAEKKLPGYKTGWIQHWACFSDGTHVIGTPSTSNIRKISWFTIFGPDGTEKGAFKHENVCSITILGDYYILTAGDERKLKIWSKDGEYIREMERDHETATFTKDADGKVWMISYSGGSIVAVETWDFGKLNPTSEGIHKFAKESGRLRQ